MSNARIKIRQIATLEHLNPTVNANPRWRVNWTNGDDALTQSDASCAVGIGNPENLSVPLRVTLSRAGRITHLAPARKFYRVHIHDCNGQGRWLAQADFAERPLPDELAAELPVLDMPGRYEVRVNVWQGSQEIGGWAWIQDGPR